MAIPNISKQVDIVYTNWRGETSLRRIEPVMAGGVEFNYNRYHPDPQWLLTALDISGDGTLKTFAMKDIKEWKPASGPTPARQPPTNAEQTSPVAKPTIRPK